MDCVRVLLEMLIIAVTQLPRRPVCVCVPRVTLCIFLDQEWKMDAVLSLYIRNNNKLGLSAHMHVSMRKEREITAAQRGYCELVTVTSLVLWTYRSSWCGYFQHPSLFKQSRNTAQDNMQLHSCLREKVFFPAFFRPLFSLWTHVIPFCNLFYWHSTGSECSATIHGTDLPCSALPSLYRALQYITLHFYTPQRDSSSHTVHM